MHFRISQLNFHHQPRLMIQSGEYAKLRQFISEKLSVLEEQQLENHFMHIACRFGSNKMLKIVIELLGDRAKEMASFGIGGGWTPLHLAASYGNAEMMRMMAQVLGKDLAHVAQMPLQDSTQALPLHLAIYAADTQVVKALLKATGNAQQEFSTKLLGNEWSFLHLAVHCGDAEMVEAVITALGERTAHQLSLLKINSGATILHLAGNSSDDEIVMQLMNVVGEEAGYEMSQVRVPELDNFIPLHIGIQNGLTHLVIRSLDFLRDKAAFWIEKQLIDGWSAFDMVAYKGNLEMLQAMIKILGDKADEIIMRPFGGMFDATPFHMVINRGNVAMAKAMIEAVDKTKHQRLVNLEQSDGKKPIHLAKRFYNNNMLNVLLEVGAR